MVDEGGIVALTRLISDEQMKGDKSSVNVPLLFQCITSLYYLASYDPKRVVVDGMVPYITYLASIESNLVRTVAITQ